MTREDSSTNLHVHLLLTPRDLQVGFLRLAPSDHQETIRGVSKAGRQHLVAQHGVDDGAFAVARPAGILRRAYISIKKQTSSNQTLDTSLHLVELG